MANPLVSVILPVYNSSSALPQAMESMLSQTYHEFELVVVDDGSTDQTPAIIQSFKSSKIKAVRQEHQGIATALNLGIGIASGQYIARMDADDISYTSPLEKQTDFLSKHADIGLVSCLVRYKGDAAKNQGYALHVDWLNQCITPEQIYLRRFQDSPVAHPSVMFRKSLIHRYGGYGNGPFPEDYDLWLRWMDHGVKMAKVQEFLLEWHDSPHRLSRNHHHYTQECFYRLKARYLAQWFSRTYPHNPPEVIIWGYGPAVKRKSGYLEQYGLTGRRYIDVKANAIHKEVLYYKEVKNLKNVLILSYVADRQGKQEIMKYLTSCGLQEGKDFLMMA